VRLATLAVVVMAGALLAAERATALSRVHALEDSTVASTRVKIPRFLLMVRSATQEEVALAHALRLAVLVTHLLLAVALLVIAAALLLERRSLLMAIEGLLALFVSLVVVVPRSPSMSMLLLPLMSMDKRLIPINMEFKSRKALCKTVP